MPSAEHFDISASVQYPPPIPSERVAPTWEAMQPYMALVRQIAFRIRKRLPGSVELDDLEQAGTIGLMAALSSADSAGRECSEAYLRLRIQGSILDSLREYDWASRYMRDRSRKLREAEQHLRQQLGREPSSEEVAEHLDLDLQSYFELAACTQSPSIVDCGTNRDGDEITIEEFVEDTTENRQDQVFENQELRRFMLMGAATLSAEHCVVLLLYYFAEWTGAQIADVLQLSEARVSQLRSAALATLRKRGRSRSEMKPLREKRTKHSTASEYRSERENPNSCIRALLDTLAICEQTTWEHCVRVEAYTSLFARRIQYPSLDLPRLLDAALLHDVGKICVPTSVLSKPGTLNMDEWMSVRRHVDVACTILSRLSALNGLSGIVRHHHENFNGGGYPDGISGEAIPLGSRIIAFADTLDALTSYRSYRDALNFDEAKDYILTKARRRFDPALCEVFESIPPGEWQVVREAVSGPSPVPKKNIARNVV
jgi:FliA/WhiG family RNA polymerase sigma factor